MSTYSVYRCVGLIFIDIWKDKLAFEVAGIVQVGLVILCEVRNKEWNIPDSTGQAHPYPDHGQLYCRNLQESSWINLVQ